MKRKNIIYDAELWSGGWMEGCTLQDGRMMAASDSDSPIKRAVYLSAPMDSGEKETVWGRMRLEPRMEGDTFITISCFASDETVLRSGVQTLDLREVLEDVQLPTVEKLRVFDELWTFTRKNAPDLFLIQLKGRYLWFKLEMTYMNARPPSVDGLRIEYPLDSIVDYLPAFYRENRDNYDFLNRYMGIYQSLIYDLQEEIDEVSRQFDPDYAQGPFLRWLSLWVGVDIPASWSDEKLRDFIKISFSLYKEKGTIACLVHLIRFCTGETPVILETSEIVEQFERRIFNETYKHLYGDDVYSFFIFLSESCVEGETGLKEIETLVDRYKPAHTTAHIILLKQCTILGQYTYLGLNTFLKGNSDFQLGSDSEMMFRPMILN